MNDVPPGRADGRRDELPGTAPAQRPPVDAFTMPWFGPESGASATRRGRVPRPAASRKDMPAVTGALVDTDTERGVHLVQSRRPPWADRRTQAPAHPSTDPLRPTADCAPSQGHHWPRTRRRAVPPAAPSMTLRPPNGHSWSMIVGNGARATDLSRRLHFWRSCRGTVADRARPSSPVISHGPGLGRRSAVRTRRPRSPHGPHPVRPDYGMSVLLRTVSSSTDAGRRGHPRWWRAPPAITGHRGRHHRRPDGPGGPRR